jgi:hypothetical protein
MDSRSSLSTEGSHAICQVHSRREIALSRSWLHGLYRLDVPHIFLSQRGEKKENGLAECCAFAVRHLHPIPGASRSRSQ